jgi:hypothetical protein
VALTRWVFRSRVLYDIDSVNFALAIRRFDPSTYQPHPPGYFLFVMLARAVSWLVPDANTALVVVSVVASCGAVWAIAKLTAEWFGDGSSRFALVLFVFSPLAWFHGIVALTYIVEAFFSALIGLWCWRAYTGRTQWAVPASAAFALAAGFRPSGALLLAPVWLLAMWRVKGGRRWLALLAAVVVGVAWFVPMMQAAGGMDKYFGALGHLWKSIPGQRTTLSSPWLAVARIATVAWISVLCFGTASALWFQRPAKKIAEHAGLVLFLWAWLLPGLLFFSFVFLNFVNSGYLLVLSPPVFAMLAARAHAFSVGTAWRRAAIGAGVAINCAWFAMAPLYCSWASVREVDRQVPAITADLARDLDPETTLVVGFDSHFLGYRHAGYYLPEFTVAQYPEVTYPEGKRVFVMRGRDTQVLAQFPVGRFTQVVFYPLPEGESYRAYLDEVLAKLPAGTMTTAQAGGRTILTGPASAIPLLFPRTARPDR